MKKISCISIIFVLISIQNAFCSDFLTMSYAIGFQSEYYLNKYINMVNANNEAGKKDALRFGLIIKKGALVTKETIKYESSEMIVGRFIVDGYKDYVYAAFLKNEIIFKTGRPNNSDKDSFLKK